MMIYNDEKGTKWLPAVPNPRRSTPFSIYAFLTWHKSFNFAVFGCLGEVVIPSEPPEIQKINNREILNLDESWTRSLHVLKSVLRGRQLSSKFLFTICSVLLLSF